MKQVCYRCRKQYGEKEPIEDKRETHGLCPYCLPKELAKLQRQIDQIRATKQKATY